VIIDAHHHLWDLDYAWLAAADLAAIRRDYTVDDLRPHLRAAGVDATVLVEAGAANADGTTRFLALAGTTPEILAVVGWADLTDPDLGTTLAAHRAGPGGFHLGGIRDQVQGYPVDFLDRDDVRAGLRTVADAGLVNEVVVRSDQLPSVVRAAAATPGTFVLDHLGKPAVGTAGAPVGPSPEWVRDLDDLARHPQVSCKLSGLPAEAGGDWTAAQLVPFLDAAADAFGGDRLMWGSDWPVSVIGPAEAGDPHAPEDGSATYQPHARDRWAETVIDWAQARGHDLDALFWRNAQEFYGLGRRRAQDADESPRRGILGWLLGD